MAFAHGDKARLLGRCDGRLPRGCDAGQNGLEILGRIDGYGGGFGGHLALALARAKLARAARLLNAPFPHLPPLILMTDQTRLRDPVAAARALPQGALAIVLRHGDAAQRAVLGERLCAIARERGLFLLIAGDPALAARLNCRGLHLPEARTREAAHWKALHPSWLITAAAHSARGVGTAARSGADAVLLAPAFATLSHIARVSFGVCRLRFVAQGSLVPVYALGGVNELTVRRLAGARLAGIAAIEALMPDHNS